MKVFTNLSKKTITQNRNYQNKEHGNPHTIIEPQIHTTIPTTIYQFLPKEVGIDKKNIYLCGSFQCEG